MKPVVSIPDDLFRRADEVRRTRASPVASSVAMLAECLQRRGSRSITASYDAVVGEVGREIDPWLAEAGRRTLERNEG